MDAPLVRVWHLVGQVGHCVGFIVVVVGHFSQDFYEWRDSDLLSLARGLNSQDAGRTINVGEGFDDEVLSFENEALSDLSHLSQGGILGLKHFNILSSRDLLLLLDLLPVLDIPYLVRVNE